MTFYFSSKGGRKKRRFAFEIGTMILPGANRRFFLPNTTSQKRCHPELILPDNYSKSQDMERMSEGSLL